jgi:tryptophanyl-tRNA synthetase
LLASAEQLAAMRANYLGGNYGYGHAKQALFELIFLKPKEKKYNYYINNPEGRCLIKNWCWESYSCC